MSEQKFTFDELVLVRHKAWSEEWGVFHYAYEHADYIAMVGGNRYTKDYHDILPYKGNEHLLGTKDDPKPKWEPKKGEVVKVRDKECDGWVYHRFKGMTFYKEYECYCQGSNVETVLWKYCEPLTEEEKGNA